MTIAPTYAARKAELNDRYDIEPKTGFMPLESPLQRLPPPWESWERLLDAALAGPLKLGSIASPKALEESFIWRECVRELSSPIPDIDNERSEVVLRRARHVLVILVHFYIHTQPSVTTSDPFVIPRTIAVPLSIVSKKLDLPLVMTYSDNVLYNWKHDSSPTSYRTTIPGYEQLTCLSTFTGTPDEQHFYLVSAHIELRGSEALSLMHVVDNELLPATCTLHWSERQTVISILLTRLAEIIDDLTRILLSVRDRCAPDVFYHHIRPWFVGVNHGGRAWFFEGLESQPTELAGSSAGQSALIHAFDAFLGVQMPSPHENLSSTQIRPAHSTSTSSAPSRMESLKNASAHAAFVERMRLYMPRKHRFFLTQLRLDRDHLRTFVLQSNGAGAVGNKSLTSSYNAALTALQRFRDAHIRIATLYIVSQSRVVQRQDEDGGSSVMTSLATGEKPAVLGTGGTDLLPFLKGVRDMTKGSTVAL